MMWEIVQNTAAQAIYYFCDNSNNILDTHFPQ